MHGLGQGGDGLPLVGDGVVPGDNSSAVSWGEQHWAAQTGTESRLGHRKAAWQAEEKQRWKCIFLNILQIQSLGKWCNERFSLRF